MMIRDEMLAALIRIKEAIEFEGVALIHHNAYLDVRSAIARAIGFKPDPEDTHAVTLAKFERAIQQAKPLAERRLTG